MSYDLHITRKKKHFDEKGRQISPEEWLAYIATDPELQLAPEYGKYAAVIKIKSQYPDHWLDWWDGNIYTKNPDEPILGKMLQIAKALRAKVQGDDLEIYHSANFDDFTR